MTRRGTIRNMSRVHNELARVRQERPETPTPTTRTDVANIALAKIANAERELEATQKLFAGGDLLYAIRYSTAALLKQTAMAELMSELKWALTVETVPEPGSPATPEERALTGQPVTWDQRIGWVRRLMRQTQRTLLSNTVIDSKSTCPMRNIEQDAANAARAQFLEMFGDGGHYGVPTLADAMARAVEA